MMVVKREEYSEKMVNGGGSVCPLRLLSTTFRIVQRVCCSFSIDGLSLWQNRPGCSKMVIIYTRATAARRRRGLLGASPEVSLRPDAHKA